jgi:hypothetical protein
VSVKPERVVHLRRGEGDSPRAERDRPRAGGAVAHDQSVALGIALVVVPG